MKRKFPAAPVAVKFVDGSDDTIEGLILPLGGPAGGRDLTGSFFTKSTDFCMDWFPEGGRPGLFRHGFDPALKASVIGREIGGRDDEKGHWLQAVLDKSHAYWGEVKELIDAGVLFLSSGSVDHLVDIDPRTGAIKSWPWVEWSLVPNPANPDQPAVREAFKFSEAAADAGSMAYTLASLTYMLGDESTEGDDPQASRVRQMIALAQEYIVAEVAEIGTPEDVMETFVQQMTAGWLSLDKAIKAGARNSVSDATQLKTAHDALASVLSLDCAPSDTSGKSTDTAPTSASAVKAGNDVEPASPEQLAAINALLADVLPRALPTT